MPCETYTATRTRHGFTAVRAALQRRDRHGLSGPAVDGLRTLFIGTDVATVEIPHRGGLLTISWYPRPCIPHPVLFAVEIEQELAAGETPGHPCVETPTRETPS